MNKKVTTEENGVTNYHEMSWQKLRALMAAENQEWQGAEHAAEYLIALDESDVAKDTADEEQPDEVESAGSESPDAAENEDQGALAEDSEEESKPGPTAAEEEEQIVTGDDLVSEPVFDPDEPYGEVYGSQNCRYFQGGHYFNSQRKLVDEKKANE